jgi:hypothetical protein
VLVSGDPSATPSVPELGDRVADGLDLIPASLTIANNATTKLDKRVPAPIYNAFDGILQEFKQGRYAVAEYMGASTAAYGAWITNNPDTVTTLNGEPGSSFNSSSTAAPTGAYTNAIATLSPNHSPRWFGRVQFPAASADVTFWLGGFFVGPSATPTSCAALRIVTNSNVFFVTRQGGSETATDLGLLSRTTMLGFIIETPDAGVTWVCRNQAGTILATSTTNVPTAATAMRFGCIATIATNPHIWIVGYQRTEATFS